MGKSTQRVDMVACNSQVLSQEMEIHLSALHIRTPIKAIKETLQMIYKLAFCTAMLTCHSRTGVTNNCNNLSHM